MFSSNQKALVRGQRQQVFYAEDQGERKKLYLIKALLAAAPSLAWSTEVFLNFPEKEDFAE